MSVSLQTIAINPNVRRGSEAQLGGELMLSEGADSEEEDQEDLRQSLLEVIWPFVL